MAVVFHVTGHALGEEGEEGGVRWSMLFRGHFPDGVRFSFEVFEPYLSTVKAWRDLAAGVGAVEFSTAQGRGRIFPIDGNLVFLANAGFEGPVHATMTIPRQSIAAPLRALLDTAVADGWKFASEKT